MAEIDNGRTVIVDRDRADRTAPLGTIVLVALVILAVLFFLFGGFSLFRGSGTNGGVSTGTQVQTPSTPTQTTTGQ